MSKATLSLIAGVGLALAAPAMAQPIIPLQNGSFETPDSVNPAAPSGWGSFAPARYRSVGDGLLPPLTAAHTGTRCVEMPTGANAFQGYTSDRTMPFNDPFAAFNNPSYRYGLAFPDFTVSGWFMIPADSPLGGGAGAGLKLEFRRNNNSVYQPVEFLRIREDYAASIPGLIGVQPVLAVCSGTTDDVTAVHTNGEWVHFSRTFNQNDFVDFPCKPDNAGVPRVSLIIFRFGGTLELPSGSGTIFWDDISFTQSAACPADFNNSGGVSVQDIFDFLTAYFAGCP